MKRTSDISRPPQAIAAYLRVSTDDQAESGLGIEAQRNQVRAMATIKGWPAPNEYVDNGVSGAKKAKDRPALAALLADIEAGEIDAVIIPSLDRLGRRTRIILELVDEFAERGVTLVSCRDSIDTTTPTGQLILTILAGLAQMERDLAIVRTKAALAEKGRMTGEMGGKLPYGYRRIDGGALMIVQVHATVVREIFTLKKRGFTLRQVASILNDRMIEAPRGGVWWASSVREVLQNEPAYKGGKRGASAVCWPRILGKVA